MLLVEDQQVRGLKSLVVNNTAFSQVMVIKRAKGNEARAVFTFERRMNGTR